MRAIGPEQSPLGWDHEQGGQVNVPRVAASWVSVPPDIEGPSCVVAVRQRGFRMALAPIPEDDPDPARQLERQTAIWLFETFGSQNLSLRGLTRLVNEKGVPGPGANYKRKKPKADQHRWTIRGVEGILSNPVYAGQARVGVVSKGKYHRLKKGDIEAVEPNTPKVEDPDNAIIRPMHYGGLVSAELWDRVQRKLEERRRNKAHPRSGGYILPAGLLRCGHCGGRMHGAPRGTANTSTGATAARPTRPNPAVAATTRWRKPMS